MSFPESITDWKQLASLAEAFHFAARQTLLNESFQLEVYQKRYLLKKAEAQLVLEQRHEVLRDEKLTIIREDLDAEMALDMIDGEYEAAIEALERQTNQKLDELEVRSKQAEIQHFESLAGLVGEFIHATTLRNLLPDAMRVAEVSQAFAGVPAPILAAAYAPKSS